MSFPLPIEDFFIVKLSYSCHIEVIGVILFCMLVIVLQSQVGTGDVTG
jgi:hypothetical protein